jgi:RNA-directed DNA polymerase
MGKGWRTDQDRASEALLMGKPAATDRPYLPSLSHSFTLDLVAGFQYPEDARGFRERLESRLGKFGLRVAREKTRQIEFGRFARENAHRRGDKPAELTFLGFTHYCGKSKQGHFKVKRRTSRKKFGQSLRALSEWARQARGVSCARASS